MTDGALDILDLDEIDARVEPFDWAFAREHAGEIEAVWRRESAGKPEMFDGEVLIQHRGAVEGRIFRAGYSFTRYKPFLAWHRLGHPGEPVRNGFAMAALKTRDGAYLLGVMAGWTANAGRIYFAAGTPDRQDMTPGGRVDLAGSVIRELGEETGLRPDEVTVGAGWRMVLGRHRAAFMRPVFIDLPAVEARALMLDRMARLKEQELQDIHIARGVADIDRARMPPYQVAFLEHVFGMALNAPVHG